MLLLVKRSDFCQTGFLNHNFGSRYASKSNKGSKDADPSLVSKKCWDKKMSHWIGARGQVKLAKNAKTSCYPRKIPNLKRKKFFKIWTGRLAASVGCWNSSLTQSAGGLALQTFAKKWRRPDFKRFYHQILIDRINDKRFIL